MARAKHRSHHSGENGNVSEDIDANMHDAFDALGGPVVRMMDHNRAIFQKMMQALHEESLKFVNRRLEHTGRSLEHSRDCHGVSGLLAVQQEWMLDCARDYADHTRRFAELMSELAEGGSARLSEASSSLMKESRVRADATNGRRAGA